MKREELANYINENKSGLFFNLYTRWQDEKENEDFNDYIDVVKKSIPETFSGLKRPFGFIFACEDGNLKVLVKKNGEYLQLFFE